MTKHLVFRELLEVGRGGTEPGRSLLSKQIDENAAYLELAQRRRAVDGSF